HISSGLRSNKFRAPIRFGTTSTWPGATTSSSGSGIKTSTCSSSKIFDAADSLLLSRISCAMPFCGSYLPSNPVSVPGDGSSLAGICAPSGPACISKSALTPKNTFLAAPNFEFITLQYVSVIRMSKGSTQAAGSSDRLSIPLGRTLATVFSASSLGRLDVLIHPEEICRVVLRLQLHQSIVGRPVGGSDAVGLFLGHEIDVSAAAGERPRFGKKFACPANHALVFGGGFPAPMHIHDVIRVPARVGHRVGSDSGGLSPDCADKDFTVRRRQLARVLDDGVDRSFA